MQRKPQARMMRTKIWSALAIGAAPATLIPGGDVLRTLHLLSKICNESPAQGKRTYSILYFTAPETSTMQIYQRSDSL